MTRLPGRIFNKFFTKNSTSKCPKYYLIDHEHPSPFLSLLNVHIVVCVSGEREENMCILEEAAAIKYVCKQLVLIGQQGGGGSGGEVAEKKEVVVEIGRASV